MAKSQTWLVAAVPGLLAALGAIQPALGAADDSKIQAEVEALKQEQAQIQQQLEDMRQQLEDVRRLLGPPPPVAWVSRIDSPVDIGSIETRGNANAKVTLIEFSDYQCPFCKRHADQVMPVLMRDYVDTGKVRYALRDFPSAGLHPLAAKAAQAARAGEQGKYWQMHDQLFAHQQELQPEKFSEQAAAIHLNAESFRECLDNDRYAAPIQKDVQQARRLGVSGTPTIVVGLSADHQFTNAVIIRGAQPLSTFTSKIDKLLATPNDRSAAVIPQLRSDRAAAGKSR